MTPELSIVTVHYHNPALLKMCLSSIEQFPPSVSYEVIVVDSNTIRESRDLVREQFPSVKLIPVTENTGYAGGINLGIKNSSGKYILILNQDVAISEGAINKLIDFIKNRPDVGLVGPQLLNFNGTIQNSYFRFYTPITIIARRLPLGGIQPFKKILSNFIMEDTDTNKMQAPDWISGAAMLTTRDAINKVGYLDEKFFFYFEDVDWSRRFWQNEYKVIYYPEAKIYHALGRGSKSNLGILDLFFNKKTWWHIKSAVKYFLKHKKSLKHA